MIIYKTGNLLTSDCEIIGHCCNTQMSMGAGIALQIKNKWPIAYNEYIEYQQKNTNPLGKCNIVKIQNVNPLYVANLFGQKNYGPTKRQVNYEAMYTALEELRDFMIINKLKTVGFPKNMGSALAGGNFDIITSMIHTLFTNFNVEIIEFK